METKPTSLPGLLKSVSNDFPEYVALADSQISITYKQLYKDALAVAAKLREHGIKIGDRVACLTKKNAESIICFWGILLARGIPVLLDHDDYFRVNKMKVDQIDASVIIIDTKKDLTEFSAKKILDYNDLMADGDILISVEMFEENYPPICYMLLTTGTTKEPRTVQVSHQNVLHYTNAVYERLGFPRHVVAAHVSTFAADLGLTNLLVALVSGGVLRIFTKEEASDPELFAHIVNRENVSFLKITPSHLGSVFFNTNVKLQHQIDNIVCGGEKLSWEIIKTVFRIGICKNLYNHYGPTETTIGSLMFKVDRSKNSNTGSVPVGTPLGETYCFLENVSGDTGELYIGGPGVTQGYFNNQEETERSFVTHKIKGKNVNCYRTRDICKKLSDGNFEFLYRTDRQVKVRGYRIELGEIEITLASHPSIENASVTLSENCMNTSLVAYIKFVEGQDIQQKDLKRWMAERLPTYKIPSFFYFYTRTPYNSNGKIDINALKDRFHNIRYTGEQQVEEQESEVWQQLVTLSWKSILARPIIANENNFFEIGGDSLLAIQLIGRLQRYGYDIHIRDLNNNPVFIDFIMLEPEKSSNADKTIVKQQRQARTISQKIFLRQNEFDLDRYCQTILFESDRKISAREMVLAFSAVLRNHSQLNTFGNSESLASGSEENWVNEDMGISVLDLNKPRVIQIQAIADKLLRHISVGNRKIAAAHLFIDFSGHDYIFLCFHHLVIDVISWNIIIEELLENYEQAIKGDSLQIIPEDAITKFYDQLCNTSILIRPPFIYGSKNPRIYHLPEVNLRSIGGAGIVKSRFFILPETLAEELRRKMNDKKSYELVGFLLSALGYSFMKEFEVSRITIDVEFHGRPQQDGMPDLSRSVSWWSTIMPIELDRNCLSPENCSDIINKKANEANNINVFADLYDLEQTRKPDIRFNYLGNFPETYQNSYLQLHPSFFNSGSTRSLSAQQEYLFFFTSRFIGSSCIIDIQYHTERFSDIIINYLMKAFFDSLKGYLGNGSRDFTSLRIKGLESNLPSIGQPLYRLQNGTASINGAKTVFLTGVTGFLGMYLLEELLKDEHITVYCLVRGNNQHEAERHFWNTFNYYFNTIPDRFHAHVKIIKGDLLQEDFGMGSAFDKIATETTTVLHVAADTNLVKDYSQLEGTNIEATASIIRFVKTGFQKELHYVSTLSVSGYSTTDSQIRFSEDDFEIGQSFLSSYEKTKFEAEKLVREYFAKEGNGKIYRVGHIAADSIHGRFQQKIGKNRVFQIIKGILLLNQVPTIYNERLAFSYVDIVARGIAGFCTGNLTSAFSCIHMENPMAVSFSWVVEMLRKIGYNIEKVEMDVFNKSVADFEGTDQNKNAVQAAQIWIQRYIHFPRRINYVQDRSIDMLARFGVYFPKTDLNWLRVMIDEGVNTGYLPKHTGLSHSVTILNH